MSRKLFGTDGIRGRAGVYPLEAETTQRIGRAIGVTFAKAGDHILIGCDPRESSPLLVSALSAGLHNMGIDTIYMGVLPTPAMAYLTKNSDASAGIMVTASHNPYTDNGIKVFSADGGKLSDDAEIKLNEKIESEIKAANRTGHALKDASLVNRYEEFLISTLNGARFNGLRIAIDMANGSTSGIASKVFEKLGAEVIPLFDKPDGKNINVACGATDTSALQKIAKDQNLPAGVAFDGDGDRLIMIDELGRQLDGDYLMYILACTGQHSGVVATILSNMGLEKALEHRGIDMVRAAVGDRYVLDGLEQTGYKLGGEKSGHIVLPDLATTGDGILASLQILKAIRKSGKSLADWFDELSLLPQSLVNIPLYDKTLIDLPRIRTFIDTQTAVLGNLGRVIIYPSGTEPKLRIMVESPDADIRANRVAESLQIMLAEAGGDT